MTLAEIKFDIIKTIRTKYNSDDVIDETHVEYLIAEQRTLWLRNKIREFVFVPEDAKQIIKCIPLIDAPTAECCNLDIQTECTIKRTSVKMPRFLNLIGGPAIMRVSSIMINEKVSIQYVKRNRAPYVGLGRFNKGLLYCFLLDDYLYIVDGKCSNTTLQAITIEGIFADPLKVSKVIDCEGESCFNIFEDEYPVPGYLVPFMKGQILSQLVDQLKIPVDRKNDSSDEIESTQQQQQ